MMGGVTRTIREAWCDACAAWNEFRAGAHVCGCGQGLASIKNWGHDGELYRAIFSGTHEPGKMLLRKRQVTRKQ